MDQMVNTVLKEQERKNKEEEDKIKAYNAFRDQQEELAEQRKQQLIKDNKRMIREYLDKQMEERRQQKEYEKQVDQAQGRIWKQDTQNYIEHEKEVNAIIRMMNKNNLNALKSQIEYAEKNKLTGGMSQNEREMNRELLDKVATMQ
jgi:di/tripeptidase